MGEFKVGVVIPAVENRKDNLRACITKLLGSADYHPERVVVVCDGWKPSDEYIDSLDAHISGPKILDVISMDKYEPSKGMEQPRNVGVGYLSNYNCNFVWFLDTDILVATNTLLEYKKAYEAISLDRVMIGPYDWMPVGERRIMSELKNDPRWDMFNKYDIKDTFRHNLSVGLACFSGNLVWPIKEFKEIGGFWNEIHMGRCEDGELGIRAASSGVPMCVVPAARGWHMHHDINIKYINKANSRDVPLLHKRHGKVENTGLKVVKQDGKRFNAVCYDCGEEFNSLFIWQHEAETGHRIFK